jgi:hypothetical protein
MFGEKAGLLREGGSRSVFERAGLPVALHSESTIALWLVFSTASL